eukprot:scaffold139008_cov35-Tisochrysis_lutea.AAC.3
MVRSTFIASPRLRSTCTRARHGGYAEEVACSSSRWRCAASIGGAGSHDGASLRGLAVNKPREPLVTNLSALEETAARADIFLLNLGGTMDDCGTRSARNAVIVRLSDAADHGDISLHKVVLRKIRDAFFGDNDVRLEGNNLRADLFNGLLFLPEEFLPRLDRVGLAGAFGGWA